MEASEAMSIVDKLTALDLRAATSAGDIAEGLSQFANLGSLAGVDIDQAAAYVATIAEVTQNSGSTVGQALKTIISRYGNVKAGAYNKLNVSADAEDTAESLNDVERVLRKIGISIRSTNLEFKDFDEVLAEIAKKWSSLDTVSQKAIANAFAGVRQQESFVTLMQNWDKYEELLDTARNSEGTAETKYDAYKESLEASVSKLTATIEDFVNNAEISSLLKTFTDFATLLAEWLPKLIRYLPSLIAAIQNIRIFQGKSWLQKAVNSKYVQGMLQPFKEEWAAKGMGRGSGFFALSRGARRSIFGDSGGNGLWEIRQRRKQNKLYSQYEKRLAQDNSDDVAFRSEPRPESKPEPVPAAVPGPQSEPAPESTPAPRGSRRRFSVTSERFRRNVRRYERNEQYRTYRDSQTTGGKAIGSTSGVVAKGVIAGVTYALNQVAAGLSAYMLSGRSHGTGYRNADGSEIQVNSSKAAHEQARTTAMAWTIAVPFIGQVLGQAIGEAQAKAIDRERDAADEMTRKAQESQNALSSLQGELDVMTANVSSRDSQGIVARRNAARNYLSKLYDPKNAETTRLLTGILNSLDENLAETKSITQLVDNYTTGDEKTRKHSLHVLELIQKQAERQQLAQSQASSDYAARTRLGDAQLRYNQTQPGYSSNGITGAAEYSAASTGAAAGIGTGVGVGLGAFGATAGGLAIAAGSVAAIPVAGWIAAAILGAAAAITVGVGTALAVHQAEVEKEKQLEREQAAWDAKTIRERISSLEKDRSTTLGLVQAYEGRLADSTIASDDYATYTKLLEQEREHLVAIEGYVKALKEYNAYLVQQAREENRSIVSSTMLQAGTGTGKNRNYLIDMSIPELRALGRQGILEIMAEAFQTSGDELIGVLMPTRNDDNTWTIGRSFADAVMDALMDDPEIASVLTGEAYTLSTALKELNPDNM